MSNENRPNGVPESFKISVVWVGALTTQNKIWGGGLKFDAQTESLGW